MLLIGIYFSQEFRSESPYDQTGTFIISKIVISPINEDNKLISQSIDGNQMYKHPNDPCRETAQTDFSR